MSPSKFFVQLKGFWQTEQFDTEQEAADYAAELEAKGETVEAWEETESGKLKDLFTGEELEADA